MISYEPLYKLLRERKIPIQEVSIKVGYQPNSLSTLLARHQHIPTTSLSKICEILNCQPEDVIEFVDEASEHKRVYFRKDWQYSSDEYVVVNWEKVCADIKSAGYSMNGFSKAMGKEGCWIAMRKGRKYTKKSVIKQIADFLGKSIEEYI